MADIVDILRGPMPGYYTGCVHFSTFNVDTIEVHKQRIAAADEIESLRQQLAAVREENERLRGVVERLPKTADGVPIYPGMLVWIENTDPEVVTKVSK